MKNKFIFLFLFLGMLFFAGNYCLAQAETSATTETEIGDDCGAGDEGDCLAGSFSCPDGYVHLTGGRDCGSGFRCCLKDEGGGGSAAVEGEDCGASIAGRCMKTSMLMCPTGYSSVSGGKNCSGATLKCCAAESANQFESDSCKAEGRTYDAAKKECVDAKVPGTGTGSGVQPIGKIDIPTDLGLPNNTIVGVLKNLLSWLLGIVGILALMGFLISGIQYLLAYSNEDLAETAKKNMTYSVMGITIALAGFIIIQAINLALQGTPWF